MSLNLFLDYHILKDLCPSSIEMDPFHFCKLHAMLTAESNERTSSCINTFKICNSHAISHVKVSCVHKFVLVSKRLGEFNCFWTKSSQNTHPSPAFQDYSADNRRNLRNHDQDEQHLRHMQHIFHVKPLIVQKDYPWKLEMRDQRVFTITSWL